jgi:hypothetical protein
MLPDKFKIIIRMSWNWLRSSDYTLRIKPDLKTRFSMKLTK